MVLEPFAQEKDLQVETPARHVRVEVGEVRILVHHLVVRLPAQLFAEQRGDRGFSRPNVAADGDEPFHRSEEHTSELQSLTNLVCRLLLEKKKTRPTTPAQRRHCWQRAAMRSTGYSRSPARSATPGCQRPADRQPRRTASRATSPPLRCTG